MSTLGLPDVKPYLGIKSQMVDAEIEAFLDAAEASVARRIGPLTTTSVTSVVPGRRRGDGLPVPVTPVISVTSVTAESGSVVTVERVAGRAGVVYSESGFGEDYYTVVYQAGWAADAASLPSDVKQAVALELKYQWEVMRGVVKRGPEDTSKRVDELIRRIIGPGGFSS